MSASARLPDTREFDDYVRLLQRHDWAYEYSDDLAVYRRGAIQQRELQSQSQRHPSFLQAYEAYHNYHYPSTAASVADQIATRDAVVEAARKQLAFELTLQLITPA